MAYKLLTGVFEGNVIEEGVPILDVPFEELDGEMQARILDWAESQVGIKYRLVDGEFFYRHATTISGLSTDQLKEDYEFSWQSEEVEDEDIDLIPVSEW